MGVDKRRDKLGVEFDYAIGRGVLDVTQLQFYPGLLAVLRAQ